MIHASPNNEHGIWGSDLRAMLTLSGSSTDWPLVKRIWVTLNSLWSAVAWDEMSGFEVNQDAPKPTVDVLPQPFTLRFEIAGDGLSEHARPITLAVVSNETSPDARRAFVAERRRASVHRFDTLHSPHYDENWGTISPSHSTFVSRLAARVRPGGNVLDAACGTGKYWPALLAAGLRVTGTGQSAGMLTQARDKHPEIPSRILCLQNLAEAEDLKGKFDGLPLLPRPGPGSRLADSRRIPHRRRARG